MTPKKTLRADLENKRALFFETGLAVSLALMIAVFSTGRGKIGMAGIPAPEPEIYVPTMMPITTHEQRQVATSPPPVVKGLDVLKIVSIEQKINVDAFKFTEPTDGIFEGVAGGTGGANFGTMELEDVPFLFVEDMPRFQGGDLGKFRTWVTGKIQYPMMAQQMQITGRVVLSFVIERDGSLGQIEVLASPDKLLADEAARVLRQSPVWTPGYQNDMPARVKFTLPIDFNLE